MSLSSGPLPLPDEEDTDEEILNYGIQTLSNSPLKEEKQGLPAEPKIDGQKRNQEDGLVPLQLPHSDVKYVFQCHGDSMLPRIQDGDYVGVSDAIGRYEEFQKGVPYLIQTTDRRLMVKKVQDPGPASPYLLLSTENPNYELADGGKLAKREFYAAYRVIMIMRDI